MTYYLESDGGHALISGSTGAKAEYGGKTVLANWWFHNAVEKGQHDQSLFVNPKGHGFIKGRHVSSLSGLARSYQSGYRRHNVVTSAPGKFIEFYQEMPGSTLIVLDECQQYADDKAFRWVLNQGGNLDSGSFQALAITQRPWNLPEEVRINMPVKIWVGPVTSEGKRFFKSMSMSEVADRLSGQMEPYQWAVVDGGELQHINDPVPEAFA